MACKTIMSSVVILSNTWRPFRRLVAYSPSSIFSPPRSWVRVFNSSTPLRCSNGEGNPPPHRPPQREGDQSTPRDVVFKAISVSKTEGTTAKTTDVDNDGTVTEAATDEWLELDQMVNSYPMARGFTVIGTGGDDFVQAMVVAVESVIEQPIPKDQVTQKLSSMGKYVSVNIGPIRVVSSEQVQAVYSAMRRDNRMKYFW